MLLLAPLGGCSASETDSAPAEVKTITFWKFQSNTEDYMISDWVSEWNSLHPETQVLAEYIPYNDYLSSALATAFATNSAPDVYMISAGSFMKYAGAGYMLPLDDYLTDAFKGDVLPGRLEVASMDDKILGLPIEIEPVGLFYSKAAFEARGLSPPATWGEMLSCAEQLNSEGMAGIQLPTQPNDYQNFIFYTFFLQSGGMFDPAPGDERRLASALAQSLTYWRELSKYALPTQSIVQIPSDIYPLATGETAMQVCGYWAVRRMEKYFPEFDFGVVPVPTPSGDENTSAYGGWFQIVNPMGEHPEEAARFTAWMWGEDEARPLEWCREVSSKFPVRNSVIENNPELFSSPADRIFRDDILPNAQPEPKFPPETAKAFEEAIQAAMFTDEEIGGVAKDAADRITSTPS